MCVWRENVRLAHKGCRGGGGNLKWDEVFKFRANGMRKIMIIRLRDNEKLMVGWSK